MKLEELNKERLVMFSKLEAYLKSTIIIILMWDCTGKQNLIKKNSVKHEMLLITSHRIDKEPLL